MSLKILILMWSISLVSIAQAEDSRVYDSRKYYAKYDRICDNDTTDDCEEYLVRCASVTDEGGERPADDCDGIISDFNSLKRRGALIVFKYNENYRLMGVEQAPDKARPGEYPRRQLIDCHYPNDKFKVINNKCGAGSMTIRTVKCTDTEVGEVSFEAVCTQTQSAPLSPGACVEQFLNTYRKDGNASNSSSSKKTGGVQ